MSEKTYLIKSTINSILNIIAITDKNGKALTSDYELSKSLKLSRTTVIEAVNYLCDMEIIQRNKTGKKIVRSPVITDYFDLKSYKPTKESQIEAYFLNLIMTGNLMPGDNVRKRILKTL